MREPHPLCPHCGGATRVDWTRNTPPSLGDIRPWIGDEGRSLAYGVTPEEIPNAKKLYPFMEYDPKTGDAIFHNDKHHRECLRKIEEVNRRLDEMDEERLQHQEIKE